MNTLPPSFDALAIDSATLDIGVDALDGSGRPKVVPSSFYRQTTVEERSKLCLLHGLYCLPTTELVAYLKNFIGDRRAIEIGAGNGVLAAALGIPATDNRMQELPTYKKTYERLKQQPVRYGDNVEKLDASVAVKRYRPDVVIGAWVTHRYNPKRHAAGGNEMGIVEEEIITACQSYVVIGNERVHAAKSIWSLPHTIEYPPWLYSRAHNGSRDFIAVWTKE